MPAPFVPTSGDDSPPKPANPQPPAAAPSSGPAVVAVAAKTTCPSGMTLTHAVCVDPTAQEVSAGASKGVSFVEAARFLRRARRSAVPRIRVAGRVRRRQMGGAPR